MDADYNSLNKRYMPSKGSILHWCWEQCSTITINRAEA